MKKVEVINKTGNPKDTEIIINGNPLPLTPVMNIDIRMRPDDVVTVVVELAVDNVDVIGELRESNG